MSSLIQLLVCHALAGLGGFFAAHHIDGSTTTGILVGLAMMALGVIISSVSKWFKLDPPQITDNMLLRQFLGAVVSQGITALSAYFATDANDPQLLAVAAINMGASKLGAHQKLALLGAKDALKTLALCSSLFALSACSSFTKQDAIIYGERVGLAAADTAIVLARMQLASAAADLDAAKHEPGANVNAILAKQLGVTAAQQALDAAERAVSKQRARLDAKQPREVSPSSIEQPPARNASRSDAGGASSSIIPDHGTRVAAQLALR